LAKSKTPYTIGIDLGGTNIQAGLVDADHKIIARDDTKTKADEGADAVVKRIAKLIDKIITAADCERDEVGAVGIGAPGAVDPHQGIVIEAVNLRWSNFLLEAQLEKITGLPVVLDNDVNVGTWGEHVAGAAQGQDDALGIFVGTGIGGGLILGGELYHGFHFTAGEIGHTLIDADAPLGRRTLENRASRTAVVNHITHLMRSNYKSVLDELSGGDSTRIRSKLLSQAQAAKDPLTLEVLGQAAHYIGVAAANTVTLLSLPCVVIGGGLTEALDGWWIKQIRASFDQAVFPTQMQACEIVASQLGDDAGVIGAADLARARQADN